MRCDALEPRRLFAAFGAPRFVRVASGQLVDSKNAQPHARVAAAQRSALDDTPRHRFESRNAVVVDASRSRSGRRPRCPARERFGPTTRPGGGNDSLRLSMVLGSLLLLRT